MRAKSILPLPPWPPNDWHMVGFLFLGGGALGLASAAIPNGSETDAVATAAIGALALLSGALMVGLAKRLPAGLLPFVGFHAAALTAGGIVASGSAASPLALLFVWVAFIAANALTARQTAVQIGLIGASYAGALALTPGDGRAIRWLLVVATAAVIAAISHRMRERVRTLLRRLAAAAKTDLATGLRNGAGLVEAIDDEIARGARTGRPFALVVAELDVPSDDSGSAALVADHDRDMRLLAEVAERCSRPIDTLARGGPACLAVVLPECDEHGAYLFSHRLRHDLRGAGGIRASFGVAAHPRHGHDATTLRTAAITALAGAARMGSDRAVIYNPAIAAQLRSAAPSRNGDGGDAAPLAAVLLLAEAFDLRDHRTAAHSETVGRYSRLIARGLGLSPERIERIGLAGVLHDIGKLAISDGVLSRHGPLSAGEWLEVRRHPNVGARILESAGLEDIAEWVLAHHERPDGTGYPRALDATEIPLEARILAVADAYEAMTAERPYSPRMSEEAAQRELRSHAGTQFDEEVVEALLRALDPASGLETAL